MHLGRVGDLFGCKPERAEHAGAIEADGMGIVPHAFAQVQGIERGGAHASGPRRERGDRGERVGRIRVRPGRIQASSKGTIGTCFHAV
jgi:hypothetical protein